MKRFLTALAVSALVITGAVVYANNRTWDGLPTDKWEEGTNWGGGNSANCPGGNTGAFNRTYDRAIFNANTNNDIIRFDGDSGADNCDCRTIVSVYMDALTAGVALELWLTQNAEETDSDELFIEQLFMIGGNTSGETVTIDLDHGGLFLRNLIIEAPTSGAQAQLQADQDMHVAEKTVIDGLCTCEPAAGVIVDLGYLVMKNGSTLTKTGSGVCESS